MRLRLKKRLAPRESLTELAESLGISLPKLQRIIRHIQSQNGLDSGTQPADSVHEEDCLLSECEDDDLLFECLHEVGRCLVCGGELVPLNSQRLAGWGEFSQCRQCGFSAHQKASFEQLREAAWEQVQELRLEGLRAQRILSHRREAKKILD